MWKKGTSVRGLEVYLVFSTRSGFFVVLGQMIIRNTPFIVTYTTDPLKTYKRKDSAAQKSEDSLVLIEKRGLLKKVRGLLYKM